MSVTAVTICRDRYTRRWSGLEHAVLSGRRFASAADVQRAWFDSIDLVRTPWFFWLDDDDELPAGYLQVIERCVAAGAPLAYTDEEVRSPDGSRTVRRARPYSQDDHLQAPTLLHHLVLCRTDAARAALQRLPRGHYWPELLLFWELAKQGAAYLPEVGYVWRRGATGLHAQWWTVLGQVQSQIWCMNNR